MSNSKISEIEKKKQELEQELEAIQEGLDSSIDEVKDEVYTNLNPKNIIKKHPLPVVGASILAGFLLGSGRKKSGDITSKSYSDTGSAFSKEIKRILTKKGVSLLLDYLENKVADLQQQNEFTED